MIPKGKYNPSTRSPRDVFVYTILVKSEGTERVVYGTHDFADALIRAGEFTQLREASSIKVLRGFNEVIFGTYRDHTGRFIAVSAVGQMPVDGPMLSWGED